LTQGPRGCGIAEVNLYLRDEVHGVQEPDAQESLGEDKRDWKGTSLTSLNWTELASWFRSSRSVLEQMIVRSCASRLTSATQWNLGKSVNQWNTFQDLGLHLKVVCDNFKNEVGVINALIQTTHAQNGTLEIKRENQLPLVTVP